MPHSSIEADLSRYPRTGRFLAGRIRSSMSEEEKEILENAVEEVETIAQSQRILERGQVYDHSTMLIQGFVLRTLDGDDQRHGVSFHVPGDFVDLHCFALKRLDHNIDTVGPVKLGYVAHSTLRRLMEEQPHLSRIFWFSTLLDAAMHREWVMKHGQLKAAGRLAHVIAEIWRRLEMVGLGDAQGFNTPLTQTHLAEMCGASPIHINRAVKQLRERDIANISRGRIDVLDRESLEAFAKFDPTYLYGDGPLHLGGGYV